MKSIGAREFWTTLQFFRAAANSARTSFGASTRRTTKPSLMPSFFGSGVPEYPGIFAPKKFDHHQEIALWLEATAIDLERTSRGGSAREGSCGRWRRFRWYGNGRRA